MTELTPYNEDHELDNNASNNTHFRDILEQQISRRSMIKKTAGGVAALTLAASMSGCSDDDDDHNSGSNGGTTTPPVTETPKKPEKLSFKAVPKNHNDIVTVPEGYTASILYALGDSINSNDNWGGTETVPSGPSFATRSGDCHDGMSFFGLNTQTKKYDSKVSDQGLLVMNHEYINEIFLHPKGATVVNGARPEDEVIREVNSHGVSILYVKKDAKTQVVTIDKSSTFNRRITAATPMVFSGPVKGNALLATKYSPSSTETRGTLNNCGNGYTPWGTYLTTEENFIGYFTRKDQIIVKEPTAEELAKLTTDAERDALKAQYQAFTTLSSAKKIELQNRDVALNRYGLRNNSASRYGWDSPKNTVESSDNYERWNASILAGKEAHEDYRYCPNNFGWIVEIDPFSAEKPVKRTALGRFAHEDARASRAIEGQNLAFYMGDDSRGEYIYKFVSDAKWDAKDINGGHAAGDKYMGSGKLYAAKFNADGSGEWLELSYGKNGLDQTNTTYAFSNQGDVLTNARVAADIVGATKMDRPEWVAVNPENGEVYVTLTNNSNRGTTHPLDAANPRNYTDPKGNKGNVNGHIVRFREEADTTLATKFTWDIYLFGSEAAMATNINLSGLTDANDFSSPDGMWFDPRGLLWVQTDDFSYRDKTNCMMLAALPGKVGDGGAVTSVNGQATIAGTKVTDETLRRFLVGPKECEITGVTMTPDLKAIFINVQHPGENSESYDKPSSHWPATQTNPNATVRPRSATVVITRNDGGVIAG